jgi:hypothetical protein
MKTTAFHKLYSRAYNRLPAAALTLILGFPAAIYAQDQTLPSPSSQSAAGETSSTAVSPKPEPTPEELEKKFTAALANVTFQGRWSSIRDGQLGPEREEKYSIISASKISSETWIIQSRIQYGDRNFVAPIPVKVKWAGDTPVITVDDLAMPGGTNKYSARVLVYDGAYAGWWSGGTRGGLLNGLIVKNDK